MAQYETRQEAVKGNRIYWLDNLRTFAIFLVVLIHASVVYEKYSIGADWWVVVDPSGSDLPGIVFLILNIFVIAILFFVAGYLAPVSLESKSGWGFLKSKLKRLMVPWAIAVLTLIPLYKVMFLYSRNLPQESWTTYFHWRALWSQNWLWFLPVLFVFDVLYLCFSKVKVDISHITFKKAFWAALVASVMYSFFMDYFNLHGWTKTVLIDFQNERILIYFLVFLLGSVCWKQKVFESEFKSKKLDLLLHCTGWIPVNLYIFMLIYSLIKPGSFIISEIVDTLFLRLNFVLSLAYILYAMVNSFRRYLNKQGKIMRELNKNSYGVYIIHVIVIGGIALMMVNTATPSLLKYPSVTVLSYIACNLVISFYRKVLNKVAGK